LALSRSVFNSLSVLCKQNMSQLKAWTPQTQ
jgi:hypothetical protein